MNSRGYILAALAAMLYGTNPAFAVPLYATGMNPVSVLFFRYLPGIPVLAAMLILRGERLLLLKNEILPCMLAGFIMALSSLALFVSYQYMNPGIASTLLFMYPVFTALLMSAFFHERFRISTAICLAVMLIGLYLLLRNPDGAPPGLAGVLAVFISALTYSAYLIMGRICRTLVAMPPVRSLLWQLLAGTFLYLLLFICGFKIIVPASLFQVANLSGLALFSTVLSLFFTIRALLLIGPTPTAILGALEPVTAVIISLLVLGEPFTARDLAGGLLILLSTILVVISDRLDKVLASVSKRKP